MPKLRITLIGKDNEIVSDRLVEQNLEFTTGPKETFDGKIRLEANLESKEDSTALIEYLQKLAGNLPLSERQEKKLKPKTSSEPMAIEPLKDLLDTAINKHKNQEAVIEYLRSLQFVFVSYQGLLDTVQEGEMPLTLKEQHTKYQFMLRRTKFAKNPKSDKFDGQLIFGFKMYGKRFDKFQVYLFGKYKKTVKMEWADKKNYNFKKVDKVYKFPDMMDYQERLRWRQEHRKLELDANYEPSKFYTKWAAYIKLLK